MCLTSSSAYSQKRQISGSIKDVKGEGIPLTSIVLKNDKDYAVSFNRSNTLGLFTMKLPDSSDLSELFIEVGYIGYKKVKQQIIKGKNNYEFILEEETIDLKEVKIKNRPVIVSTGDTLSYKVNSFARLEDRSIGDVIRRLPGVNVAENGQITFNGKSIQNLYIQGDDLMDGRYGLATKIIKKEMVESVDILEHFQPINVLKGKVVTDDVAMNLVLRDAHSLKLAGQAMIGAGLPEQYDVALNTMMFNNKIKFLNSLKANNYGIDLRDDFAQLGTPGYTSEVETLKPENILTLGTVGNPNLPKANYYFNNSKLLSTNNLINLKNGLQVKSNIQLFDDKNRVNYISSLDNYLNDDTVSYKETQNLTHDPYSIQASLTATANKSNYFLNNKLSLNFAGNRSTGYLDFNNDSFDQNLREKTVAIFNDFSYTPALKNSKNVIDLRWHVEYFNNPQRLNVNGGQYPELLNDSLPYKASIQQLKIPTFFNHASAAYRIFNDHLIQQNYQVGVINERQQFKSALSIIQLNNSTTNYKGDNGNDLNWQRDRVFVNSEYVFKKGAMRASVSLPISGQSIRYSQDDYDLDERKSQLLFTPNANLSINLNAEDFLAMNYRYNKTFGDVTDIYRGAILGNYRTIFANNADLQERKTSNLGLVYNFKRSIIMLLASARIDYKRTTVNTIVSSELTQNVQRTILLPYKNDQSTIVFNADLSKFVFAVNTTFSVNSTLSQSNYNQLINGQIYPFKNNAVSLQARIDSKLFDALTLSYDGMGLWNQSKQKPVEGISFDINSKIKRFNQSLNLGYSPVSNLFINLIGRQIYGNQAAISNINYLFVDTKARYNFVKLRMDLELEVINIGNIKNYEVISLTSNQLFFSRYELRGRMALLRATFNL